MTRTKNNNLVARMTIRKNGKLTMTVEIHTDAGHNDFYHWMKSNGIGRGRLQVRTSNRNDGQAWTHQPRGLEVLAKRFVNGEQIKITILKKRLYKKFLSCPIRDLPGFSPVTLSRTDLQNRRNAQPIDILRLLKPITVSE